MSDMIEVWVRAVANGDGEVMFTETFTEIQSQPTWWTIIYSNIPVHAGDASGTSWSAGHTDRSHADHQEWLRHCGWTLMSPTIKTPVVPISYDETARRWQEWQDKQRESAA